MSIDVTSYAAAKSPKAVPLTTQGQASISLDDAPSSSHGIDVRLTGFGALIPEIDYTVAGTTVVFSASIQANIEGTETAYVRYLR